MAITYIACPKGTEALVDKIYKQTKSYPKTKTILQRQYGITISLEIQDERNTKK